MKYLITGRTGSGSRYLMNKMKERGMKDITIVTPNRIEQMANAHPTTPYILIFIQADYDMRKAMVVDSVESEIEFRQACTAEQEMFASFEKMIASIQKKDLEKSTLPNNIMQLYPIENDYEDATMSLWAEILLANQRKYDNMLKIIRFSVDELGIMRHGSDGKDTVAVNVDGKEISTPIEIFADTIIRDNEGLLLLFRSILESADITLTAAPKPKVQS